MSDATIQSQAEKVAARVDANAVGFDPITIITILSTVLPLILKCFQKNDEPDPAQVNAAIKKQHESAPGVLRRRTMRRIRGEADQPMTKDQAYKLADAVIAEACEADSETIVALCASIDVTE